MFNFFYCFIFILSSNLQHKNINYIVDCLKYYINQDENNILQLNIHSTKEIIKFYIYEYRKFEKLDSKNGNCINSDYSNCYILDNISTVNYLKVKFVDKKLQTLKITCILILKKL